MQADEISAALVIAREAMGAARADLAIGVLEALVQRAPAAAAAWQLLGFAFRDAQRMAESERAFARAVELTPEDALSALAHAETCFESGLPAAALARRALGLAPENPVAIGCCAAALAAEGQRRAAENLLVSALARRPDWLEGQKLLAALRYTGGDNSDFARGYAAAVRILPQHLPLRMAWFRSVAQARNWVAATHIIDDCENSFGAHPAFTVARLFIASESGDTVRAAALFAATAQLRDEVRDLAWVRHCLRTGDRGTPDLGSIVLDPPRLRIELRQFAVAHAVQRSIGREQHRPGRGRARVEHENQIVSHGCSPHRQHPFVSNGRFGKRQF